MSGGERRGVDVVEIPQKRRLEIFLDIKLSERETVMISSRSWCVENSST